MNKNYGYARVSSVSQNIDRQISALKDIGICEKDIFIDKKSGMDFNRPSYRKMIKKLNSGDCLYIKSIDRLGRNYDEIIDQWRYIVREKNVDIIVLDFPLLDTRNKVNGITGKFISDLVLQILSYVAQIERENIKQRQAEGIQIAKAQGKHLGRPKLKPPKQFSKVCIQWESGKITKAEAARRLNTNSHTFSRWVEEHKTQEHNTDRILLKKNNEKR
ncbi:recombinase family protein [Hespellia stercorisuis]|uniref:Site-specific DNA recombinase n=1 Tax=Hespellia stercorisuis DSM 15480 TaxID=1121950 RepID=A0A1M6I8X0_9FIRM|nr:recombinase family protein [Hespellia stercorisuis]SHJ30862.1 Site-specific DNA recombinase [Hespellia stercorisuis DSM 15480]